MKLSLPALLAGLSLAAPALAAPQSLPLTRGDITFAIDAPLDVITGRSRGVRGAATVDFDDLQSAKAELLIDLSSFRTGIDLRDEDLRDQFFETSKFTTATLTIGGLERLSAPSLSDGATVEATATGALALHGASQEVKIPVVLARAGDVVIVKGNVTLDLERFGMKRPRRLIFKLGKDVAVSVVGRFRVPGQAPVAPPESLVEALPPEVPVVAGAKPPKKKPPPPKFVFAQSTAEGRGERALVDPGIGGKDNAVKCKSCHSVADERLGTRDKDGTQPPARSLYGVAGREVLWQGLAKDIGDASSVCARLFMRRQVALEPAVASDITAYLKTLPADRVPSNDLAAYKFGREAPLARPTDGNIKRGEQLAKVHCNRCHAEGRVRPPLTPGLYEADFIVRRVRWLPGHDAQQMPPLPVDRLSDAELRDIVSWLADDKQQIFSRKRPGKSP